MDRSGRWLVRRAWAEGDAGAAVSGARRWIRALPESADAHAHLVESLARSGDRPAAYRAYEEYAAAGRPGADRLRELVFRGPDRGEPTGPAADDEIPGDSGEPPPETEAAASDLVSHLAPAAAGRHGWISAGLTAAVVATGLALAALLG